MSAFICSPDHFKVLAVFAASRRHGSLRVDPRYIDGFKQLEVRNELELASAYADVLYAENIRSVLHRYPDDTLDSAPGPIDKPESITVTARDVCAARYRLPPVAILSMCDCLEYQSCETEDWASTPAWRLLNAIRRAAIRALPGYDDAPWDYCAEEQAA